MADDPPPNRLPNVPDQDSDPVEWDPVRRAFVPRSAVTEQAADREPTSAADPPAPPARDPRRYYVGSGDVGKAPPPRAPGGVTPAPVLPQPPTAPPAPAPPGPSIPAPAPRRPATPTPTPTPRPARKPSRSLPKFRRPKLKWILLFSGLFPILLLIAGFIYADIKFRQIDRVPVGSLLDSGGSGENILIVGSDTRANADPNADNAGAVLGDATDRAPTGQRSDTIMVLRLQGDSSKMLSIPRDLIVPIAETKKSDRINSAYNVDLGGGPARLLKTVQQSLGIPINRYMEVDFVTFAGLVDAVGGITIDFPYPAFDTNTGLDIKESGPVKLNGEQSLAYVRSRHYTEIKEDGKPHEDPTADLGRIQRQQTFLRTIMGKVAGSHNPFTLLRAGGEVAGGIRIDDELGLWDAMRLAWDLKGINPEPVPLPVGVDSNGATLHLVQPDAEAALAQFQ
jgi:LCP family protein required for cell wall assembly